MSRVLPSSKSPSPSRTEKKHNTAPFAYGVTRNRQLPTVEDLKIPAYAPQPRSLIGKLWYKFQLETAICTFEWWEQIITVLTMIALASYTAYLSYGAGLWILELTQAELSS